MSSKGTIYLTVLALGVFAYIFFFERHTLDTEQRAEREMRLFPEFDVHTVTSIEIIRSNSAGVIRVERTNDQWQLMRPIYPARSTAIENWLSLFTALHRRAYISAEELQSQPGGLAAFGLEDPPVTVTVYQGQQKFRLRLGAKTPVGEKLYVKQVGSDGVFVTESALLDRLPQSALDWRDPTFLRLAGLGFDRLSVRAAGRDFAVERDAATRRWRLAEPRSARADNGLLQELLQQLQDARVAQFVSDTPGGDLEPYGLQTPELTMAFGQGTGPVLTVEFGRSPANDPSLVYARRSSSPMIVTVPRQLLELLRAPYTDFLDKRLIEFAPGEVDRIQGRAAETFALQRQANGTWRIVEPFDALADRAFVQGFLSQLNSLQIVDRVKEVVTELEPDLPKYGLSPPTRAYILETTVPGSTTNQPLARIDFGTTNQSEKIYVRRSDENSIYTTRLDESLRLPQAGFELRDRRIWNFTTNQVTGVTITINGRAYKLQRNAGGKWGFADVSQGMINAFALEEAMFRFGQLWSQAWIARGEVDSARYGFTNPPHRLAIDVKTDDQARTLTVEFGTKSLSAGPYAVVDLEGARTVFECPFKVYDAYSEVLRSLTATVGTTR